MIPPFTKPRKGAFVPPAGIRMLPLTLLRSSIASRDQALAADAMASYRSRMPQGAPAPTYLPINMIQQQWKRGDGGENRGAFTPYDSGLRSFYAAATQHNQQTAAPAIPAPPVPPMSMTMFANARGYNNLPQPATTRGSRPVSQMLPAQVRQLPPPGAAGPTADQLEASFQAAGRQRFLRGAHAAANAQNAAQQRMVQIERIVGGKL